MGIMIIECDGNGNNDNGIGIMIMECDGNGNNDKGM